MQVGLNLTFLLNFSRKLFFDKNDVETLFSENRLQNRGAHYTRVNTVSFRKAKYIKELQQMSLCLNTLLKNSRTKFKDILQAQRLTFLLENRTFGACGKSLTADGGWVRG